MADTLPTPFPETPSVAPAPLGAFAAERARELEVLGLAAPSQSETPAPEPTVIIHHRAAKSDAKSESKDTK